MAWRPLPQAWAADGGSLWVPVEGICRLRDIAVTDHEILVACDGGRLQAVSYH